jgi:hypothetical protein
MKKKIEKIAPHWFFGIEKVNREYFLIQQRKQNNKFDEKNLYREFFDTKSKTQQKIRCKNLFYKVFGAKTLLTNFPR